MIIQQTSCKQCGICCIKGGPALHGADIDLLRQGSIPRKNLISIRKGEFAYNPVIERVQATQSEIVKLKGSGGDWTCCYYDPESHGCSTYDNRPLACVILQCWNPDVSLALVEKDLLSRLDIVSGDKFLVKLITEYELACPLPDCEKLSTDLQNNSESVIAKLEDLVNCDLQFRNNAVARSDKVLDEEMFLFGRPLFQIVQSFGLLVSQYENRLHLKMKKL